MTITVTHDESIVSLNPSPSRFIAWKDGYAVVSLDAAGADAVVHVGAAGIHVTDTQTGNIRHVATAEYDRIQVLP